MKPLMIAGIIVLILIICIIGFVVLSPTAVTPTPPPPADVPCVLPNGITNGSVIADPVTQTIYVIKDCKKCPYTYPSYVAAGSPHAWIQTLETLAAIPMGTTI